MRFVLRENVKPIDAGIDHIAQNEVDEPADAAKGNSGLCPMLCQWIEPLSFAPGKDHGKNFTTVMGYLLFERGYTYARTTIILVHVKEHVSHPQFVRLAVRRGCPIRFSFIPPHFWVMPRQDTHAQEKPK